MSKTMRTLAATAALSLGVAVSGAAFAGCSGYQVTAEKSQTTIIADTGSQTPAPVVVKGDS